MTWETTYCDKDVAPDCPGHQGWNKFPDCLTEEVWLYPDESTGNIDGFGHYVSLVLQHKDETTANGILVRAGTYMVIRENDQGHILVTTFDAAQDAQDAYDKWESAYGDYCAGQDADEESIMASSGLTFAARS